MKFLFSSTTLSLVLVSRPSSIAGSSDAAESNRHLQHDSVSMASEDDITSSVTMIDATIHGIPRVLKKKAKGTAKEPKRGKVSKLAKGSASPSSPPTSQDSSQPTSPPTGPCASISDQKDALLALKAGFTNGDTLLSDWSDSTKPCSGDTSNWVGITCNSSGEVTEIKLEKRGFTGTISPLIACPTTPLVSSLTSLNFMNNNLTGEMPSEICALRDNALGSLSTLTADHCGSAPEVTCLCCTNICF